MKYTRLAFILFCLLLPFQVLAQESPDVSNNHKIDQILEFIPIKQTLNEIPKELKTQFSQNPFGISASKNNQLIKRFNEVYNADSLSSTVYQSFKENFDPSYSDSVLSTLQSDTVKPILSAEANYYTIQGIREQIVTKYEIEQNKPSQNRISIIENIINHRSTKESEIKSQTILFRSLVIGTNTVSNRLNLSETQINSIVDNFNNRLQMQLKDELVNNHLVMYHKLEDNHLKKYADFYTTEAGTELKESVNKAIHTAFQKASDQFISNIDSL